MKNIFITGALGQDGKILTKILLTKKKYRVFLIGKISDMSFEEYEQCIAINVTAPFLLTRELSKNMIKNQK